MKKPTGETGQLLQGVFRNDDDLFQASVNVLSNEFRNLPIPAEMSVDFTNHLIDQNIDPNQFWATSSKGERGALQNALDTILDL